MIYIGLDISTINAGIAVFKDNELYDYSLIPLSKEKFSNQKVLKDAKQIDFWFNSWYKYGYSNLITRNKCIIVIEYGQYGPKELISKLAIYLGMFINAITYRDSLLNDKNFELKFVTAKSWQWKAFKKQVSRKEAKKLSIERAKTFMCTGYVSDDVADAINIASLAEELEDYFVSKEKKLKAKRKKARNEKRNRKYET